MPLLRLAYTTQFLLALIAVFFVWEEVGGPYHLELMPWWLKFGLGTGVAYAVVRATAASVAGDSAWNRSTARWCVAMAALAIGCAVANYYCDLYGEEDEQGSDTSVAAGPRASFLVRPTPRRSGTTLSGPVVLQTLNDQIG